MTNETTVRERGILMHTRSVLGILEGRKTQTRRVVKPQPECTTRGGQPMWGHPQVTGDFGEHVFGSCFVALASCPYGAPGDRLYVREAWRPRWTPGRGHIIRYRADGLDSAENGALADRVYALYQRDGPDKDQRWRPSIHMPKWAARIWLEITGVRVERVQEIAPEDAVAEGVQPDMERHAGQYWREEAVDTFAGLWDQTNGHRDGCTWEDDPWVWVIEFRRVDAG